MKFLAIVSLFALSAVAAPVEGEAPALQPRFDCGQQRPRCPGGDRIGQTHCLCPDQVAPCFLRACPGSHRVRPSLRTKPF